MKVLMTGGGTAGHVTPNLAVAEEILKRKNKICYIGSINGMERSIVENANIEYYGIHSGKLRRYISIDNIKDVLNIFKGFVESYKLIGDIKPDVVFSKGGFVACPVVWASKLRGVRVIIHESDMTPGLTNKLCSPFADKICYAFSDTMENSKFKNKSIVTGIPIRKGIINGSKEKGLEFLNIRNDKPILLVMGGSLGSHNVNTIVRNNLNELTKKWNVVHIVGKGNCDDSLSNKDRYIQYEYITDNIGDVISCADMVVSRAGATSIFEILSSKKPALFIPLSKVASRGDQILNANFIKKSNLGNSIEEEHLSDNFIQIIDETYKNRFKYKKNQSKFLCQDSAKLVSKIILEK